MELIKFFELYENIRKWLDAFAPSKYVKGLLPEQLSILILVKLNPNITHKEISDKIGMPISTVSRNCHKMTKWISKDDDGNKIESGYGLLALSDYEASSPKTTSSLTQKGEDVIVELMNMIAN